jgi:hypothetical protein
MFNREINVRRLVLNAPNILEDCWSVLSWLDNKGESDSVAALKIRSAINLLEHAGVEGPVTDFAEEAEVLPPDFSLTTTDIND